MTDKENIISKIQKLLNVSKENGASENEAMVAAERAQRLLSEHKLSLKDVEHKEETIQFFEEVVPQNHKWKDAVYHATAKLYFCKTYQSTKFDENYKKVKVIKFAGRESNKIVALEMTKYFIDTCERLAEQEFKSVIGNKTQINSMKRNYLIAKVLELKMRFYHGSNVEGLTVLDPSKGIVDPNEWAGVYENGEKVEREILENGIKSV